MPRTILREAGRAVRGAEEAIPWTRWALLVVVAVVGSCCYGASLSLVLPGWNAWSAAIWLALAAGLAWCVFIPVLCLATGLRFWRCFEASLLTMAAGEIVLTSGALSNALLLWYGLLAHAALINGLVVALSNVTMAVVLARLLRANGVPVIRTVTLWMLALNGSGAVFFFVLHQALHGP